MSQSHRTMPSARKTKKDWVHKSHGLHILKSLRYIFNKNIFSSKKKQYDGM